MHAANVMQNPCTVDLSYFVRTFPSYSASSHGYASCFSILYLVGNKSNGKHLISFPHSK